MTVRILHGDCRHVLASLPAESVHCVVTSPPYFGLRDYGVPGQIGLEPMPDAYVAELVAVFREVRRVMRRDATAWLNLGDSFQSKQLLGVPWRVAFALQADGWWLRSDIIWAKPNPMPESVTDRPTSAHEHVFLLAKSQTYYFDAEAVKENASESTLRIHSSSGVNAYGTGADWKQYNVGNGHSGLVNGDVRDGKRNIRNVWTVATQPYSEAHFATFPPALIEPCIKAGTSEKGCCPHCGGPWERMTESKADDRVPYATIGAGAKAITLGKINPISKVLREDGRGGDLARKQIISLGWQFSCSCPAHQPVPCTVLDPFGGAGTTGLVADRLGRNAILIELNPAYAEMTENRLRGDAGMFASVALEAAE